MNLFKRVINVGILLTSLILLVGSWGAVILALMAVYDAVGSYELSITKVFLDAKFGYSGLLSFGLSSCALILASASVAKIKPKCKFIRLFKVTFFVSIFFLLPTIFAIILFLYNEV